LISVEVKEQIINKALLDFYFYLHCLLKNYLSWAQLY